MVLTFFIATKNPKKHRELERILAPLGFSVVDETALPAPLDEVEETGTTFEENAYLKASAACAATGMAAVADDSGLCVEAISDSPGVESARYAGENATDADRIAKLLDAMEGVPVGERGARFVSVVCCVLPDGRSITVRGECEGHIAFAPQGNDGFGYDPVFLVGSGKSFAQLTPEKKDEISHRGQALRMLARVLPGFLKGTV